MGVLIFILLILIAIGLIYIVHRYLGKKEFYLLAIIYSIISFMMSFKIIKIFGLDINMGIVFSSSLVMILYYFIYKYDKSDAKKIIITMIVSTLMCAIFLILNSFMISSLYDTMSVLYQNLILNNIALIGLYPISLALTLFLSNYCFSELKGVSDKKIFKSILVIIGIAFIDTFIFIYFSYAIIIRFDIAMVMALGNYLLKTVIMIIFFLIINKLFEVRKVK